MIGVSKEVQQQLEAFPAELVSTWFSPAAHKGQVRVRYARSADGKDRTSWLPSSRHMRYLAKGWTCVELDLESIPAAARK